VMNVGDGDRVACVATIDLSKAPPSTMPRDANGDLEENGENGSEASNGPNGRTSRRGGSNGRNGRRK